MRMEQHGWFLVPYGTHWVEFRTPNPIERVYTYVESEGAQVCASDEYSSANAYITEDGFAVRVHVATDNAEVHWLGW